VVSEHPGSVRELCVVKMAEVNQPQWRPWISTNRNQCSEVWWHK